MYANLASSTKLDRANKIISDIGTSGLMNFYTGPIPPSPDVAPTGTLLVSLPLSATAGVASLAVQSAFIVAPGTGGTDNVYALTFTGGAGSGAAGIFTVTGGVITSTAISVNGSGYTSAPTISGFGSAGVTGASMTAIMTATIIFNTISTATAIATGTAGFVRVSTSEGTGILDLDVGTTNGYSVIINNTFISFGGSVSCTADVLIEA